MYKICTDLIAWLNVASMLRNDYGCGKSAYPRPACTDNQYQELYRHDTAELWWAFFSVCLSIKQ